MSILVLGTVALDSVKTPHGHKKNILGGSAAHFSMSARLFTKVNLVAVIGEDFPKKHIHFLRRKGVNLSSLEKVEGKTFHWEGKYEGDMNAALTLNTELGVLAGFKPKLHSSHRNIRNLFLANVDPDIQMYMLKKMRLIDLVGCDSMNFWIENRKKEVVKLIKKVDIFVANDAEARSLSGETNLLKAAKYILKLGAAMTVIKKGEHGLLFASKKHIFSLPGFPVETIEDPTGAGDTFAGGFMGYLVKSRKINQQNITKALAYGTVCASFNVEGFGVQKTKNLTLTQVNNRLSKFRKIISF